MRETGIGTSLVLIAAGAVLAFAVNAPTRGIDLNAVGVILLAVGLIGLLISLALAGGLYSWGDGRAHTTRYVDDTHGVTPPHEHRHIETTDVVYEDTEHGPHVDRVERIRRV